MLWEEIVQKLDLKPLPQEGGYYRETYRANVSSFCNENFNRNKEYSTAIFYLITAKSFSALHRVPQDEVFHFYAGSPVEMLQLQSNGGYKIIEIGSDIMSAQSPQVLAPKNIWQGTRLKNPSSDGWALLGTTVAPAFEFQDFELGSRQKLSQEYPSIVELIEKFTHVEPK
jgi:uncharacterized protein